MSVDFRQHLAEFYSAVHDGDTERALGYLDGTLLARDCVIDGLDKAKRQGDQKLFEALVTYLCTHRGVNITAMARIFEDSPAPWVAAILNNPFEDNVLSKALFACIRAERLEQMEVIFNFLTQQPEGLSEIDDVLTALGHYVARYKDVYGGSEHSSFPVYQQAKAMYQATVLALEVGEAGASGVARRM